MKKKGIDFEESNGCLIITSHRLNKDGYAYVWHNGRNQRAHRLIYEECFGEISEGLVVRHKCDNPSCINPEHLEIGTPKDNTMDAISRCRTARGEKNGRSKLTSKDVIQIRKFVENGMMTKDISKITGINFGTVRKVRERKTWKHIG